MVILIVPILNLPDELSAGHVGPSVIIVESKVSAGRRFAGNSNPFCQVIYHLNIYRMLTLQPVVQRLNPLR